MRQAGNVEQIGRVIARELWEASQAGSTYATFQYGDMVFGWWPAGLCQARNEAEGTEVWVPTGGGKPWSQRPGQRVVQGWMVRKDAVPAELRRFIRLQLDRRDVQRMLAEIAGEEQPEEAQDPFGEAEEGRDPFE